LDLVPETGAGSDRKDDHGARIPRCLEPETVGCHPSTEVTTMTSGRRDGETTVALLRRIAAEYPGHDAYVEGTQRLTFSAWDSAADGLAGAWIDAGVGFGDVVALMLPSSIDYAICYQGAMRVGAVTTGLNPRLGRQEVESILQRTHPRIFVVDDELSSVVEGRSGVLRSSLGRYYGRAPVALPALNRRDPVAIVWTSGTTGQPKGAVFTHRQLAAVGHGAGKPFDRRISAIPFAHVGYMAHVWEEIGKVNTVVIPPTPWRAVSAIRLMESERITVGQGVPAQWRLIMDAPEFATADLSALRIAGTGGAAVAPELIREMQAKLGCPVVVGYTSTEAAITTGLVPGDPIDRICTTVGRARPTVELRVVDDDGRRLPVGENGWVQCRSAAVMEGYWADPAATATVISADGWLTIGDLGHLDDHGYLVVLGRGTEMYIRGGYNVYPAEVEGRLIEHPAVHQVAVVSAPDPVFGEIGVAFVVPDDPEQPPTLQELRTWCSAALADYKAPNRVELVDELPLTPMAKVDKLALTACAAEPSLSAASEGLASAPALAPGATENQEPG
jgi:acyl-CoA synthetase (AMP-forming)/AMP-acid ligase II